MKNKSNVVLDVKCIEAIRELTLGSDTMEDVIQMMLTDWQEHRNGQVVFKQGRKGTPEIVGKKIGTVII